MSEDEFPYLANPETFKNDAYRKAVIEYPLETWVVLTDARARNAISVVKEVVPSADGPLIRVSGHGLVPVGELRLATQQEVDDIENE